MGSRNFGPKWIQVDLDHFEQNLRWIESRVTPAKLMPVIKANAYGHGAIKLAQVCERMDLSCLVVATLREALELRRHFIKTNLLVLGVIEQQQVPDLINYRITPTICRIEDALVIQEHAKRVGRKVKVQVYVDTGMGRMGQHPEGLMTLLEELQGLDHIELEALYSHFAVADEDDSESIEFTHLQVMRMKQVVEQLQYKHVKIHMANSGGVLMHRESWWDAVRPGLICYGIGVSENHTLDSGLKPIMSLACYPSFIKRMKKGESVGYGRLFKLDKDTNIMTLPVGYADGVPRRLASHLKVKVKEKVFPVVGRICMDMLMVDLGDTEVELNDPVVLLGEEVSSVEDWASWSDTIPYEIFTQLGRRWNYVYTRTGKVEEIVLSES